MSTDVFANVNSDELRPLEGEKRGKVKNAKKSRYLGRKVVRTVKLVQVWLIW